MPTTPPPVVKLSLEIYTTRCWLPLLIAIGIDLCTPCHTHTAIVVLYTRDTLCICAIVKKPFTLKFDHNITLPTTTGNLKTSR